MSGAARLGHALSHPQRYAATVSENGILAEVPGEFVAEWSLGLPDPNTSADLELSATVNADWARVVQITYRRQLVKHRKHSHWYWQALRADVA